jgi:ankyrin repeat protein
VQTFHDVDDLLVAGMRAAGDGQESYVSTLPPHPHLGQLRRQAKELLRAARAGQREAVARLAAVSPSQTLAAAQLSIAHRFGFASWPRLKLEVETRRALDAGDLQELARLIAGQPQLARSAMRQWSDHLAGVTPLGYVAMLRYDTARRTWRSVTGTAATARALLAAGAPVDGHAGDPETPLITAASYGDADVARTLLEAGADVEARAAAGAGGVPGGTALLHAAVFGMTDVVDVLVAAGARVHSIEEAAAAGDIQGWLMADTPPDTRIRALVMAADHERLDVIDQLVEDGVPVDAVDEQFGRHALRLAAANGRVHSVTRLLALGADPNLRDRDGHTPLDQCRLGRAGQPEGSEHAQVEALLVPLTEPDRADQAP